MEARDLKNFGKPLKIPEGIPKDVEKKIRKESLRVIRERLGLLNMVRFLFATIRENRRMQSRDLSAIRQKGLTDDKFIKGQIQLAAAYSAMSRIVGKEEALDILTQVAEVAGPPAMSAILPHPEDFRKVGDPLRAYRDYYMAIVAVDKELGIHDFEIIEDGDDAFQVNVTYCAYCEIPKQLGVMEACRPSCYADDVFFPGFCAKLGMRFIRKGTLARGDAACDFRYERVSE